MKKKYFLLLCICWIQTIVHAQTEGSAFNQTGRGGTATTFVTDYQAIGINPANLGFDTEHKIGFGIGELGFSFYSEALVKDEVRQVIFNNDDMLDSAEQQEIAQAFLNNGVTYNVDVRVVGLSFKVSENAAIALSFDGSGSYYSKLGEDASQIIFEGYDFSGYIDTVIFTPTDTFGVAFEPLSLAQIFNGTDFRFNVRSDINLAFGTKLFGNDKVNIYGGIGVKYILGFAYLDFHADETTITGLSSLGLDLLNLDQFDTQSEIITESYKPVGKGFGVDLGMSATIGEKLTLGLSVIDIGKMTYKANVVQFNNVVLDTIHFSGVTSADPVEILQQLLKEENIIAYEGLSEFDVSLPTTLRIGAGYEASALLNLGADIVMPLNNVAGAYETTTLGLGGELTLLKVLKLSTGFSVGGGYGFNMSGGIGLDFKIWEMGIATRDLLTLFGQERPTVSMAVGVLRFKI